MKKIVNKLGNKLGKELEKGLENVGEFVTEFAIKPYIKESQTIKEDVLQKLRSVPESSKGTAEYKTLYAIYDEVEVKQDQIVAQKRNENIEDAKAKCVGFVKEQNAIHARFNAAFEALKAATQPKVVDSQQQKVESLERQIQEMQKAMAALLAAQKTSVEKSDNQEEDDFVVVKKNKPKNG